MEIKQEVRSFRITMKCDKCGEGEVLPTGAVYYTAPAQYGHQCNKCEATFILPKKYPYLSVEPITTT